jgi:hypothetical protein
MANLEKKPASDGLSTPIYNKTSMEREFLRHNHYECQYEYAHSGNQVLLLSIMAATFSAPIIEIQDNAPITHVGYIAQATC